MRVTANSYFSGACGPIRFASMRASRACRMTLSSPGTPQKAYRQIGNGVAVPVAEWVGREIGRYFGVGGRA